MGKRAVGRCAVALLVCALAAPAGGAQEPSGSAPAVNSVGMRMVMLPAGGFLMGSPSQSPMRQEEELPHRVTLTRAFRIAATEVTQKQWLMVMENNPSAARGDDLPVTDISWHDAVEFCHRLSAKEKVTYRLPTEAEWEYACRADGEQDPPRSGLDALAWYSENSDEVAHPAGAKKPNGRGLHDMLGNVAEWTLDAYGPYPRGDGVTDPAGPASGTSRVVRGGSWRSFAPALRCAARVGTPASYQLPHVGLRIVQELK
jgi:formylglycine-generating enzyme required for sulfatase activity